MRWAAVAYSLGIIYGARAARPSEWWIGSAVAFLAFGVFFLGRRRWLGMALALGAIFFAAALNIQLRGLWNISNYGLRAFAYGPEVTMTAHVIREGRLLETTGGDRKSVV